MGNEDFDGDDEFVGTEAHKRSADPHSKHHRYYLHTGCHDHHHHHIHHFLIVIITPIMRAIMIVINIIIIIIITNDVDDDDDEDDEDVFITLVILMNVTMIFRCQGNRRRGRAVANGGAQTSAPMHPNGM